MRDNYKEPELTYALDSSGKMVHIGSVERGLSCNCRCPKCNESLVAKLGHEGGRQAHFAHLKNSDCHGFYVSAMHKLAEQIIEEEMAVMVPAYKEILKQKLEFEKVEVEQRIERKDLQPDIVGVTSNGLRWFIEIRNTHEVDEAKRAKLIESNITCLEIDIRKQTLENLKSFLLESTESREWINNPNYESQIEEKRNKDKISDSRLSSSTQERIIRERYYTKFSPSNASSDALPFDKFWTIEDYYKQLQSTGSYETEKGLWVKIVKCDKTNNGILLLYKDPEPVTPFHIAIIKVSNGDLIRNKVADFTKLMAALDTYDKRLRAMRDSVGGIGDDELPF